MTRPNALPLAILFSDIKGYSKMDAEDRQIVSKLNNELEYNLKEHPNFLFFKSMGDGLIVVMNDSLKLAEFAIQLRDRVRNTCWIEEGMADNMQIRIGLHFGNIELEYNENKLIKDVIGDEVIQCARIEPITTPNDIFCSNIFFNRIKNKKHKVRGVDLGEVQLAKNHGLTHLYKLCWDWEYELIQKVSIQSNDEIQKDISDNLKETKIKVEKSVNIPTTIIIKGKKDGDSDTKYKTIKSKQTNDVIESDTTIKKESRNRNGEITLIEINTDTKYTLEKNQIIKVGRGKTNDLICDDGLMSREHCTIRIDSDRNVYIEDNNSTNGTLVNNNKIEPNDEVKLKDGDKIEIGNMLFEITI